MFFDKDTDRFIEFAKQVKGVDLSGYRKNFIARRLAARFLANKINLLDEYTVLLGEAPGEWTKFLENLCINVSEFFRDPEVFKKFQSECIAGLIEQARPRRRKVINVWSCGCSCGEESYSLAILFSEFFQNHDAGDFSVEITATDADVDALMKARQGIYFANSLVNVGEDLRARYFTFVPKEASRLDADAWQVNEKVRRAVSFKRHDLITDEMPKEMDVIFLRNVGIYFDRVRARNTLINIHGVLSEKGILVLGKIESIGITLRHLFRSVDAINRIYRKI